MTKRPSLAERMKAVERAPAPAPIGRKTQASRKPYHAATRVGMKKVTVTLEPAMRKQLKRLAVEDETTIEELMRTAIAALLAKRHSP